MVEEPCAVFPSAGIGGSADVILIKFEIYNRPMRYSMRGSEAICVVVVPVHNGGRSPQVHAAQAKIGVHREIKCIVFHKHVLRRTANA